VLASRLSEDPGTRVCLVEAGPPDRSPLIHVPLGVMALIDHRVLNWRYRTTPQAGLGGRPLPVPRGRTLGGSSSINGMVYTRGHRRDYDDWAAAGNAGWSYAEVLPYFRRSENNEDWPDSPYHGRGGPLNVVSVGLKSALDGALLEAAEQLQFRRNPDFCGAEQEGFGMRQVTQRNGRRASTAAAFLKPARRRSNLTVVTGALAARVVLAGRRAVGVELAEGGRTTRIEARREVIVAAGTVGSPALLMRSGIGEPEHLSAHGIAAAHALPAVGRNLQDHLSTAVQYRTASTDAFGLSPRTVPWLAWSALEYLLFRRGLFASNILQGGGFVRTRPGLDRPDVYYVFMPAHRSASGPPGMGHGYGLITVLSRPRSRGTVRLGAADPATAPLIDPNFLSEPEDLDTLLRGVKLARRILAAPAFARYAGTEIAPGPGAEADADLADFIRRSAVTVFHPVGTCRMGTDAEAVVDPQLRVRGIEGLRVVDASIMPTIIGGNTNAPVIMIAEKAADMIRGKAPPPLATGV
jgi:choline dehydrogenase-like flavoprotein